MKMEEATKHGIKTQNLPKIILKKGGIAGEKQQYGEECASISTQKLQEDNT